MRHRVREVEEKGPGRVLPDEARCLLGVAARDRRLIGRPRRHPVVAHQGHVPVLEARVHHPIALFRVLAPERGARDGDHVHVVRIGDPEVVVETVRHGQEGGQVPEVPLADGRGRVPACPENLGNRDLGGGQPAGGIRIEDALVVIHGVEAGADGQAAGEEGGAAGRANGLAHVEARPLLPFGGHAIEARSADGGVAEHAEVAPPHVVGQDDHDVGRAGGRRSGERSDQAEAGQCERSRHLGHAGRSEAGRSYLFGTRTDRSGPREMGRRDRGRSRHSSGVSALSWPATSTTP